MVILDHLDLKCDPDYAAFCKMSEAKRVVHHWFNLEQCVVFLKLVILSIVSNIPLKRNW